MLGMPNRKILKEEICRGMMQKDIKLYAKAHRDPEYAFKMYLKGKNKGITWDTKLGEFLVYSGIAYQLHQYGGFSKMPLPLRELYKGLVCLRIHYGEKPKAVRLRNLKELMESGHVYDVRGKIHPRTWGKKTIEYLNDLLAGYRLEPIDNSKLLKQNNGLESLAVNAKSN